MPGAYGLASCTWGTPARLDTRYDCASTTKVFTAVATLQQVHAGAFSLHTSAVDYLRLTGTTISPAVTVHHLLSHTSGIGEDADEEAGESYEALWRERPNYAVRTTADFLPNFIDKPPNFTPGRRVQYRNVSYILLGLRIEKATGRSYRDYIAEHVFAPAGMGGAGFSATDQVVPDVAEGVELVDGALLPEHLARAMITPDGHVRSYWKEGIDTGASAMLRHYPGTGATVAVLSNLEEGVWEPLSLIHEAVQHLPG